LSPLKETLTHASTISNKPEIFFMNYYLRKSNKN
jgi:hypothetical protein